MKHFIKNKFENIPFKNRFDSILNDFFSDNDFSFWKKYMDMCVPIDIKESKHGIVVNMEISGFKKEDIYIHADENNLTIEGEKKKKECAEGESYVYSERNYGKFKRIVKLPKPINLDQVKASFEDGVLIVDMKKIEETKNRKIKIE